jgi:hypothetical protein
MSLCGKYLSVLWIRFALKYVVVPELLSHFELLASTPAFVADSCPSLSDSVHIEQFHANAK